MSLKTESKELKPGDTRVYEIGGQKLTIAPIPWGQVKKLVRIIMGFVQDVSKKAKNDADIFAMIPDIVDNNVDEILPLLFDLKRHLFLNKEWINDHMSLLDVKMIVEDAVQINGLKDFFGQVGLLKQLRGPKQPLEVPTIS
jgi:hypothetical protein